MSNIDSNLEIFFPTKDRNDQLQECIESIQNFHPNCLITIANCSLDSESTSKILKKFSNIKEFVLNPDPGMSESFNFLINSLTKDFVLWLSDDAKLIKSLNSAIDQICKNQNLMVVGLGLYDHIHYEDHRWDKDEYGCALWIHNGRRVGHFCLAKKEYIKKIKTSKSLAIDFALFHTLNDTNYSWLNESGFIEHHRYLDETRKKRIW